ncbi:alpha-L RNA-binding motif-containing protein [Irpex rosettiformis]|uniref:Alpha-L RNA-binding motif-containing protein n=1 Tax=Irpex rosettiformis TaxID=378272 RepID=A0ACB8TSL7_9APHY|nr:alpha-L RNA-binding motif-containing protein [Irpex rosettiformis]
MRELKIYDFNRCLPRMSWSPQNLYNLYRRSIGDEARKAQWTRTTVSLFSQRWQSKALTRAYHGDFIPEKIFKRWYLPKVLPDVRPRVKRNIDVEQSGLARWAKKDSVAEQEEKIREEEEAKGLAPVGSLMFMEVERRIDVVIFRACLAPSVYEARRMVVHGSVLLNGKKHENPGTRLAPGDLVSVDPAEIRFLQHPQESSSKKASEDGETENTSGDEEQAAPERIANSIRAKPYALVYKSKSDLTPFNLPDYASPFLFVPAYLEPSFKTCSVVYVRHPTARPGYSEIPTPYDADGEIVRFAWEWYAKRRPKIRSKSQRAREPENRQALEES